MRRSFELGAGCLLACAPAMPGDTESTGATGSGATTADPVPTSSASTTGMTSMTGSSSSTSVTTTDVTSGDDGLVDHGPCPGGTECELCVQSEGASVCAPLCPEYGPGWAGDRCPPSSFQLQTICPWEEDTVPGACLITCGDASDCPDPAMVCVLCPEPFKRACDGLWGSAEKGPNICAWPAN